MTDKLIPVLDYSEKRRERIRESALEGVKNIFPIIGDHRTIEVSNVQLKPKTFSGEDHKNAILEGRSLTEPIKADVVIKDKEGNVLDKQEGHTLLQVPYFTPLNTFVVRGNEYSVRNQLRTKPGVYTRVRGNGDLETSFNLKKGANFRLSMNPEEGHLNMEYGTSKIPLYSVLREMGVPHQDIAGQWGEALAADNKAAFDSNRAAHAKKLYEKLVPSKRRSAEGRDQVRDALHQEFGATELDEATTAKTLGRGFSQVTPQALLAASGKLLKVHKGEEKQDNRDSLEFQTLHTVEDFVKERLDLTKREFGWKTKSKLDLTGKPEVRKVLPTSALTPSLRNFLTTSQISVSPTQINPVEILNAATNVTRFGEGGIQSDRAIPGDVRTLHPSHLGILDPFRTPESGAAGVDVGAALFARKDKDGNIYTVLKNAKTGKVESVSAAELDKATIAFPNQDITKGRVDALAGGEVKKVRPGDVDYQVTRPMAMYGVSTNLIPFMDSAQGNRLIMASKFAQQAVPLKDSEAPLVQVNAHSSKFKSWEEEVGNQVLPRSAVKGTVSSIRDGFINIRDEQGELHKTPFSKRHPLASKTYLSHYLKVKPGDEVDEGQVLADSNFTRDGTLALGKNLKVGYVAYHGLNSNDAVVLSESAANRMSSKHMVKKTIQADPDTFVDHKKHSAQFPRTFTDAQYANLEEGLVKPGTILQPGDPIAAVVRKAPPSVESQMFGRIHKSLRRNFRDQSLTWDKDTPGEVVDVVRKGNRIAVTVKSVEPMKVGDKLSNRYGGKGVVAKIVKDDEMLQDEGGKPLDLLWTSAGVISRINPGQILETAVAKVAEKQGKPIVVDNFAKRDNVQWAKQLLKDNDVKDKETLLDPVTGKKIPNIFVGPQYTYKMFKSTDTNFSARGVNNSYDINQQPGKGGIHGAKGTGRMEINALLAHDARDTLKENATVRGTRNTEYWRAVQLGRPLPPPKTSFAYDKFTAMLQGMGVNMQREDNQMSLAPLTDKDVEKFSAGKIDNAKMVRAKDLRSEKGGLFDEAVTGGLTGQKWSHIELDEPVVSPVFQDSARRVLGMTNNEFTNKIKTDGGAAIKRELNAINAKDKAAELRKDVWKMTPGSSQDNVIKQIKALEAVDAQGLKPGDAWTMKKVPVLPPMFRPIVPGPRGDILVADVNHMYKDALIATDKLKQAKDAGLPDEDVGELRKHLHDAVGAVVGTNDPVSTKLAKGAKKGLLKTIVGTKTGFYNAKLIANRLDTSGRGTAAPDPSLGMDEVGIPEDMAWEMYNPFIMGRLVKSGQPALRAKQMVEERGSKAREAMLAELKSRPLLLNRAPTLHKHGIVASYAKPIPGKTIKVNPFIEHGMNLDYDGDALQVHVPAGAGAVRDAQNMLVSNNVIADKNRNEINVFPAHEAIIGLYKATEGKATNKPKRTFATSAEAMAAYHRGEVGVNDPVEILKP